MVVLPMPSWLLDIFFVFNIAISIVVLMVSILTKKPLEFASFPSILLIATLLRLALNIASTRVVLINGHEGDDAAGQVIKSFGDVVIGGNYVVGLIVFIILMVINFVVITKGAGRISEVSARFTLDAMPGKQMAIDADLNAGLIDQDQARKRRREVAAEAEFYGSMDGASKFVKGDAIAGLIIMAINIIGGMIVGIGQHDLLFADATQIYTKLTIGDGLVAQIPSLLLSVSTAIIVTRQNEEQEMGTIVLGQMFGDIRTLFVAAGILFVMGVVPGMPHFAFLLFAGLVGGLGYFLKRQQSKKPTKEEQEEMKRKTEEVKRAAEKKQKDLSWDDVQQVDTIGLEIGYRLIPLVDKAQNGELLNRVKGVRKKLSQELGFLVPAVHIRDNLDLAANNYRITIMGVNFGESEVYIDKQMAINPGEVFGTVKGIPGVEPAFGLEAVWINNEQSEQAQSLGYTVVDTPTVIATHLSQILMNNASSLLGHEEVQNLLDLVGKSQPKLVEGLIPGVVTLGILTKVLQNLLFEEIPIKDMRTILQTIVEYAPKSQDVDILTAACRVALRRLIIQNLVGGDPVIPVITLAPDLEKILHRSLQAANGENVGIEPGLAERMQQSLAEATHNQEMEGQPAILLTSGVLRGTLAKFVKNSIPGLRVLSYQEIPDEKQIRIVCSVGQH
ncbi:MAG: flagellar biosynthesis protein FlhA [Succinivibrionaceae bacterium]|nr:flagellar biosynthesis protein FlhA [Succinivibrionaceae bacterium]MBQ1425937.1 flagellar biosynthesis protein FlhA [Succinivibrionaceae bacterium]MBQ8977395.1 flagellar biosynthesis protein FlhA [Succinivibrionaceae bacterium]